MESSDFLAIDFGVASCTMAWFDSTVNRAEPILNAEGETKTPSVVYYAENGDAIVGKDALQVLLDGASADLARVVTNVKLNLTKGITYPVEGAPGPVEASAAIFAKLKRDSQDGCFHRTIDRAVITHPVAFGEKEKAALKKAGELAGFREVSLMEEPVAAAVAWAANAKDRPSSLMVFDMGAGTLGVALLARQDDGAYRPAISSRSMRVAGNDFDMALYRSAEEKALAQFGQGFSANGEINRTVLHHCRARKENLSRLGKIRLIETLPQEGGTSASFAYEITREEFEELIEPLVDQAAQFAAAALKDARRCGIDPDAAVLMGGSTRIPLVARRLKEAVGLRVLEWEKRDVAVALGAATHAGPEPATVPEREIPPTHASIPAFPSSTLDDLVADIQRRAAGGTPTAASNSGPAAKPGDIDIISELQRLAGGEAPQPDTPSPTIPEKPSSPPPSAGGDDDLINELQRLTSL